MKRVYFILLIFLLVLGIGFIGYLKLTAFANNIDKPFSGESAYQFVVDQVHFGPRTPQSLAHQQVQEYIVRKLDEFGWQVKQQNVTYDGHEIHNIIASRGDTGPITLIGAHYDSRLYASEESCITLENQPVPGANDGASGVAVLLELARTLPSDIPGQIWLVFFDAEDQGRIEGWDWILGSRAFVQNMTEKPSRVVILDMIGDANLNIYQEKGSDPILTQQIWDTAAALGYSQNFINESRFSILDDHLPFVDAGIPAIDIIDFDYQWWHTTSDTVDKVSPESLEIIGKTITSWLESNP
jgi:Zn-dependent M28 family amino/carboxypeptidase